MPQALVIIGAAIVGACFGALFGLAPAVVMASGFAPGSVFPLVIVGGCAALCAMLGAAAAS